MSITIQKLELQLCNAFLQLKNRKEIYNFLNDVSTPAEMKSMEERLEVANLLMSGFLSYREIHERTKVSIATITRVARFVLHENNGGYKAVLKPRHEGEAVDVHSLYESKDDMTYLSAQLCDAFLVFKTPEGISSFLRDICTPAEIKSMEERLEVAILLMSGFLSYREIHERTKVSIATIARVARFVLHEKNNGYNTVLKRLREAGLLASAEDYDNVTAMAG